MPAHARLDQFESVTQRGAFVSTRPHAQFDQIQFDMVDLWPTLLKVLPGKLPSLTRLLCWTRIQIEFSIVSMICRNWGELCQKRKVAVKTERIRFLEEKKIVFAVIRSPHSRSSLI